MKSTLISSITPQALWYGEGLKGIKAQCQLYTCKLSDQSFALNVLVASISATT